MAEVQTVANSGATLKRTYSEDRKTKAKRQAQHEALKGATMERL